MFYRWHSIANDLKLPILACFNLTTPTCFTVTHPKFSKNGRFRGFDPRSAARICNAPVTDQLDCDGRRCVRPLHAVFSPKKPEFQKNWTVCVWNCMKNVKNLCFFIILSSTMKIQSGIDDSSLLWNEKKVILSRNKHCQWQCVSKNCCWTPPHEWVHERIQYFVGFEPLKKWLRSLFYCK